MTIKKQFIGYLQKLNSKLSGDPVFQVAKTVSTFQEMYPEAILCGSGALILSGMLPYRKMHDIDFIVSYDQFYNSDCGLWTSTDTYAVVNGFTDPKYTSYIYKDTINNFIINLLVFGHKNDFNIDTICNLKYSYGYEIKCQSFEDIISWKQKYNRPKDKEDLRIIMDKAFDDAVFTEEK